MEKPELELRFHGHNSQMADRRACLSNAKCLCSEGGDPQPSAVSNADTMDSATRKQGSEDRMQLEAGWHHLHSQMTHTGTSGPASRDSHLMME